MEDKINFDFSTDELVTLSLAVDESIRIKIKEIEEMQKSIDSGSTIYVNTIDICKQQLDTLEVIKNKLNKPF